MNVAIRTERLLWEIAGKKWTKGGERTDGCTDNDNVAAAVIGGVCPLLFDPLCDNHNDDDDQPPFHGDDGEGADTNTVGRSLNHDIL